MTFPSDLHEALDAMGREIFAAAKPPEAWTYNFTDMCTGSVASFVVHFDTPNGHGILRLEPGDGNIYGPFSIQTWDRSANPEHRAIGYRAITGEAALADALADFVGAP